jgi:hypothetical protein
MHYMHYELTAPPRAGRAAARGLHASGIPIRLTLVEPAPGK